MGAHEYREVAATFDRHELLAGLFDGFHVMLSERGGGCEILFALENKNGNGKFQAEFRRPDQLRLLHQTIGAQHLAVTRIIDVLHPKVLYKNSFAPSKAFAHFHCTRYPSPDS